MGWCTELKTTIHFHKETYNHKYEVEEAIEKLDNLINIYKKELSDLALMTDPKKFMSESELNTYDIMSYIRNKVEEDLECLEEDLIKKYKLELLLDKWDECHTSEGLAIEGPDNEWETSYMWGDFVFTDKHPTQKSLTGAEYDINGKIISTKDCIIDENGKFKDLKLNAILS